MNPIIAFKNLCCVLLKAYTPLTDILTIKAYARTLKAESKLLTAIYNAGHVKEVMIMNREVGGLYTLKVETDVLTTRRRLQKRIAYQLARI